MLLFMIHRCLTNQNLHGKFVVVVVLPRFQRPSILLFSIPCFCSGCKGMNLSTSGQKYFPGFFIFPKNCQGVCHALFLMNFPVLTGCKDKGFVSKPPNLFPPFFVFPAPLKGTKRTRPAGRQRAKGHSVHFPRACP